MLSVRSVTKRFGQTVAVDDVSLDVGDETVAILGRSGCGKSTLLRVIAGDIDPDSGEAALLGVANRTSSLRQLAKARAYVGPQTVSDVVFRVRQVVAMGLHPSAVVGTDAAAIVTAAMARVDVEHLAERELHTLSSGEQQRVAVARAIAQRTPVLLLDEPTSALDVGHQEMLMGVLRDLAGAGGAVVAALHDLNLAAAHADRVLLLDRGVVIALGPPREVLTGELLTAVYRQPMEVIDHPFRDCPLVLTTG